MESTSESLGFSEKNFSWEQYVQTRPTYPESFFQRIYNYHNAFTTLHESNRWTLAMDIGAGHGILSEHLARRFDRVVVVEPNEEYLAVARSRLPCATNSTQGEFSFIRSGAEDEVLPANSADLVLLGMSIQWTDTQKTMTTVAHHLRPGGTAAIVFYRRPYLTGNPEAADIWDEIWNEAVGVMMNTGQMDDPITDRAWRLEDSGLDSVEIPTPPFRLGVKRIKINATSSSGGDVPFAASLKHARPANSVVSEDDVVQYVDDAASWRIEGITSVWLMKSLKSYLAGVEIFDRAKEESYMRRLEQAMKGSGSTVDAVHPVSIILATKAG